MAQEKAEVKEDETTQSEEVNEGGLVDELRDFASQMGISPQGNTKEFRELVVDYIQKKAVGVFDMSSTTATQLLGKPEATAEYQSMLDEAFTAFEFNDAESNDMLKFASTPDKMKEMDEKYFQQSENFREMQKEYRGQGGSLTSEKAASFYKAQRDQEKPSIREMTDQDYIDRINGRPFSADAALEKLPSEFTEEQLEKLERAKITISKMSAELEANEDQNEEIKISELVDKVAELKGSNKEIKEDLDDSNKRGGAIFAISVFVGLITATLAGAGDQAAVMDIDMITTIPDQIAALQAGGFGADAIVEALKNFHASGMEAGSALMDFIKGAPTTEVIQTTKAIITGSGGGAISDAVLMTEAASAKDMITPGGLEAMKAAAEESSRFHPPSHNWNEPS